MPEPERVAIVGPRDYSDLARVAEVVAALPLGTVVVTGGARGVDRAAEAAARRAGLEVELWLPDYRRSGRAAPLKRNETIAERCTRMIAFHDGTSRGTAHAIACARRCGRRVQVLPPRRAADSGSSGVSV